VIGRRKAKRVPKRKRCEHFEKVADVCHKVLDGEVPPSDLGTTTLAEEYLLLHLEFEALRTHLGGER
jgi:hypothetical protein